LETEISKGNEFHAYLLKGKDASRQARLLAMALNCCGQAENAPCFSCSSCRALQSGAFTDLHEVFPQNKALRIEQIRKIQTAAGLAKINGRKKIIILYEADSLREEAANSLLKILEDPPPDTVFILTAENGDRILPTIISRCRVYHSGGNALSPIDETLLAQAFSDAEYFLESLPQEKDCLFALNRAGLYEKDKDALKYMLLALWQLLAKEAAGRGKNLFPPTKALRAALFTEKSLELLGKNINHRILADVVFLRLWKMSSA
jgi:DNA polymerase-3 subunit delta'